MSLVPPHLSDAITVGCIQQGTCIEHANVDVRQRTDESASRTVGSGQVLVIYVTQHNSDNHRHTERLNSAPSKPPTRFLSHSGRVT